MANDLNKATEWTREWKIERNMIILRGNLTKKDKEISAQRKQLK